MDRQRPNEKSINSFLSLRKPHRCNLIEFPFLCASEWLNDDCDYAFVYSQWPTADIKFHRINEIIVYSALATLRTRTHFNVASRVSYSHESCVRIKGMNLCRFINSALKMFLCRHSVAQALAQTQNHPGTYYTSSFSLAHYFLGKLHPRRASRQSFLLVAMSVCWFASKEKRRGGKLLELQRHHTHRWLQTIRSFYWFLHFPIFPYPSQCVATIFGQLPHITSKCVLACIRDWCIQSDLLQFNWIS